MRSYLKKVKLKILRTIFLLLRWFILHTSDRVLAGIVGFVKRIFPIFSSDRYIMVVLDEIYEVFKEGGEATRIVREIIVESDPDFIASLMASSLKYRGGLLDAYIFDKYSLSRIKGKMGKAKRILFIGRETEELKNLVEFYELEGSIVKKLLDDRKLLLPENYAESDVIEFSGDFEKVAEMLLQMKEFSPFVSLPFPRYGDFEFLKNFSFKDNARVRVRNPYFYYQPVLKAFELLSDDKIGWPMLLEMKVFSNYSDGIDEKAILWDLLGDLLGVARRLMGEIVSSRSYSTLKNDGSGSYVLNLEFERPHSFGYIMLNFVPEIADEKKSVRIWVTGTDGVIILSLGSGLLQKLPVLILREGGNTTIFEDLRDRWERIYESMAAEAVSQILPAYSLHNLEEDYETFQRIFG